jgi:hypothetical protein
LVVLLLVGLGYGAWLAISPFLPESAANERTVSRVEIGDDHLEDEEWLEAIAVFREMLEDDPDNGFAVRKIAHAWERQLLEKWEAVEKLDSTTGSASVARNLRKEEDRMFKLTVNSWYELLEHGRYRSRAYQRLASLHSLRYMKLGDKAEFERAFDVLEEMLEQECFTERGIYKIRALSPLHSDERFRSLANEEYRLSNKYRN